MKKIISTIALISALFLFSGCESWDTPSTQDTRASQMGNAGSLGGANIPGEGFGADANGLSQRGDFGDLSNIDYEHLNPENILETIYFGFDQYSIPANERGKAKSAASQLTSNSAMRVILVAHTDWLGTEEYNLLLSDKRGAAVQAYLQSLGVAPEKAEIVARGKQGATPDVAKNSEAAKKDRRVDIYRTK